VRDEGMEASEVLCHHRTGQVVNMLLKTDIWALGSAATRLLWRLVKESVSWSAVRCSARQPRAGSELPCLSEAAVMLGPTFSRLQALIVTL